MSQAQREPQQASKPKPQIDLSDAADVAERNKGIKSRTARIQNGLKLVMGHPDSRLWLHDLLAETKPLQEAFTGNSATFYNCGQQSIGKKLMVSLLNDFLDEYVLMMKEASNA